MLYGDWISLWGDSHPRAEALVDIAANHRYSYQEMRDHVYRMAAFLSSSLGVRKGDRIAVLSSSRAEYFLLFFASSRLGAILVPLPCDFSNDDLLYCMKDSTPAILFYDKEHRTVASWLSHKTEIRHSVCFDGLSRKLEKLPLGCPPRPLISTDDPVLISYVPGAKGVLLGAVHTHGSMTWSSINANLGWGLYRGERTLVHTGPFDPSGLNGFALPIFHCIGTNILVDGMDADRILDLIEQERITILCAAPALYQVLSESPKFGAADFSNVWLMLSFGAPLPRPVFEIYKDKKGALLREGYGLAETGPGNFLANGKPGTAGHPMPHVDIRLVDENGRDVPQGVHGRLLIKGDHLFSGYWNQPKATAEAKMDGWFCTRDFGCIDEDGHMLIVGRKEDRLISHVR